MTDYTIPMIIGMTLAFALGAGLGGLWGLSRHEWLYCRVTVRDKWGNIINELKGINL